MPCMNTQKINKTSFNGIKLSFYDDKSTRRIVKYMRINGFDCVGKKTYYMNNKLRDKVKASNFIRERYKFYENEFGVLFLPWSRETYFLSEPKNEQIMLEWVQEMDPNACINLII